jgi:dienelactone hydrolase
MKRTDVSFDSWGDRCGAWLYRPEGAGEEALPCVVMAHGFGATRDLGLAAFAERFADEGLAALVFDYRHFGASEGEPRQLLDVKRQLADWAAAISYARAREDIDGERIALWGSSFSGGHVLTSAARDRRVAAVVSQVPFIDGVATLAAAGLGPALRLTRAGLRDQLGAVLGRAPHMLKIVGPPGSVAAMTSPDAEPGYRALIPDGADFTDKVMARIALRVASYWPGRLARRIACPVLVCVGDEDAVTPPRPAIRVAKRLPKGELRRYPCGHFDVYVDGFFERVIADQVPFLRKHLRVREMAGV